MYLICAGDRAWTLFGSKCDMRTGFERQRVSEKESHERAWRVCHQREYRSNPEKLETPLVTPLSVQGYSITFPFRALDFLSWLPAKIQAPIPVHFKLFRPLALTQPTSSRVAIRPRLLYYHHPKCSPSKHPSSPGSTVSTQ